MDYNSKIVMLKGADGAGIKDIKKTSTNVLTDTYTITLSDGQKHNFDVTNGKGIKNIEKASSSGLVDTYTITYNDGTTQNYTLNNGKGISSISKTGTSGLVDTYTTTYNDGTTSTFEVTNGMNANGREVLRTLPNIEITANADINTAEYLNVGSYTCPTVIAAQTISNIPVKTAFCMYVIALFGGAYGSESSMQWTYRMRIFIPYGGDIYVQYVHSEQNPGEYNYFNWKRLISSDELIAIPNSDIDTILNS